MTWLDHVNKWKDCKRCPLHDQRDRIVLARGQLPCTVLFVGEAPGASEDALGAPFVGPAGQLLDQIIERALPAGTTYALTNLVACYPREAKLAGVNEPEADEILACRERFDELINIARPRLIVCLGVLAENYVAHDGGVKCVDVVHPAHIKRMPLTQRLMAAQKCAVVIRTALNNMEVV